MPTTISVSDDIRKKLLGMKVELGYKSIEELLQTMITYFENKQLERASELFRKKLKEKNLSLSDIQRENERIRKEVYAEWFEE